MTTLTARDVYRRYNTDGVPLSGDHEPDKPEIIQLLTSYESLLRAGFGNVRTPDQFGALADGVSDDAQAIRDAMDWLSSNGGGILLLGAKQYLLSTTSGNRFILPKSNVSIIGQGVNSILKVADHAADGDQFIITPATLTNADRVDFAEFRNFTIDCNGANNNASYHQNCAIAIWYGFALVIDNVWIRNCPGSQPIAIGLNAGLIGQPAAPTVINVEITNNKILESGTATNLAHNTDWSGIFCVADDSLISGNQIENSVQDSKGTGIEMHGNGVCFGNVISRIRLGFNVGGFPNTDVVIFGNKVKSIYQFLNFWDTLGGGEAVFNTNALVEGNFVTQVDGSVDRFIDTSSFTAGTGDSRLVLRNNEFASLEAAATASFYPVVSLGKVKNIEIVGNAAKNFAGQFVQNNPIGAEFVADIQSLVIDSNVITDCCRTTNGACKTAIGVNASNALKVLSIRANIIENTGTVYMTTGIAGTVPMKTTSGRGVIAENLFYNVTTNYSWTGLGRVDGAHVSSLANVTQAPNKSTGVTLDQLAGQITMNNAALAASTSVVFILSSTQILATDSVQVNIISGQATPGTYFVQAEQAAAGTVKIHVRNISAGSLSEALVLGFKVNRGAI